MTKMNEPEYDSDLSDFDKQFFSSSGRFNINQVKSTLENYDTTQVNNNSRKIQPTYSQYSSLNKQNLHSSKNEEFKKLANKTCDVITSSEFISAKDSQLEKKSSDGVLDQKSSLQGESINISKEFNENCTDELDELF